ncbi:hypothetical protein EYF80_026184 [Liparis tanakae]|uniref:Uncharacterized protein n=1 Tax=Liparis tanakae TaxID=230148 RepID=A0A4Z2HCQ1_9TELE|nr:hypothetical protein EYF80_026184 [Liparis tanakae]
MAQGLVGGGRVRQHPSVLLDLGHADPPGRVHHQHLTDQAYPNVQLRPLILFPFEHFRGSIRRAATPGGQRLPSIVEVSKSKVAVHDVVSVAVVHGADVTALKNRHGASRTLHPTQKEDYALTIHIHACAQIGSLHLEPPPNQDSVDDSADDLIEADLQGPSLGRAGLRWAVLFHDHHGSSRKTRKTSHKRRDGGVNERRTGAERLPLRASSLDCRSSARDSAAAAGVSLCAPPECRAKGFGTHRGNSSSSSSSLPPPP